MNSTKPDPDSNYLSKYIVDFNKRELDKFFHPEKYPKVALSLAALGVVAFLFVAWMFPLKDAILKQSFQKSPASASIDREVQNVSLTGPTQAKVGDKFAVEVSIRTDNNQGKNLAFNMDYPPEYLELLSIENNPDGTQTAKKIQAEKGFVVYDFQFPKGLQTDGKAQQLLTLIFRATKPGRANLTIDDSNTIFNDGQSIYLWKNNYSLLITQ